MTGGLYVCYNTQEEQQGKSRAIINLRAQRQKQRGYWKIFRGTEGMIDWKGQE